MKELMLIIGVILVVLVGFIYFNSSEESMMYSTWIWDTSLITDDISEFNDNNIDNVYLYIDTSVSIESLYNKVKILVDNDIDVEFLFGDPNYILPNQTLELDKIYDYIESFNNEYIDYQVKTVHVDVEPYILNDWESKQDLRVLQFQDYINLVKEKFNGYLLNIDVPFWYDEIIYDNEYGNGDLFKYLTNIVDGITIMAYNDSYTFIIDVTAYELSLFDNIEIAVEYGDIEEINTTFYDEGKTIMFKQLRILSDKLNSSSFAIHEIVK